MFIITRRENLNLNVLVRSIWKYQLAKYTTILLILRVHLFLFKKNKKKFKKFYLFFLKKKSKTLWKFSILLKNKSFVQNSLEFFTVLEINFLLQNNHGISHHQKEIFRKLVSLENKSSRTIFINQKPLFSKGKLH